MRINEIFYSLQGEGFHTGTPSVFVRFAGCNLRCPFCDTDFTSFVEMSEEEVLKEIQSFGKNIPMVVVTGGEPSLQLTGSFVELLHKTNYYVAVETNGTQPLPENVDWVTCSPKEGSEVVLPNANEIKVVYVGQDVEKWHTSIVAQHYFLQPCSCANTDEVIAYIKRHPHWRLSLQTHKMLGIR